MFQSAQTGDAPGEHQYWVERDHLDTVLLPAGFTTFTSLKDRSFGVPASAPRHRRNHWRRSA
jgi:hypothetical protein